MTETPSTFTATPDVDEEFFTGVEQVVETVDYTLPVSVAGRGFLIDRSPDLANGLQHSRRSIELINSQNASGSDDASALPPEVWRRIADSWHQGAGQARFDRPNALPYRFADSHNVDVWDEWSLKLLPGTEMIQDLSGTGNCQLTTVGPGRFVAITFVGGETTSRSYWWTDVDVAPIQFTLPATVLSVCSDGRRLITLDVGGAIRVYDGPTAGTLLCQVPGFQSIRAFVAYVKGFIITSGGGTLYDVTTGTPVPIYTHPLESFTWRAACDGMAAAYLLGGGGDKWGVYAMGIADDATTFDPPFMAAPIPEGEIGYAIGSYLGYILIGCNTGWRFGIPAGDGTLTFGKLIETKGAVKSFEGQDRFVWYGRSSDGNDPDSRAGLGRADLSQFVAPMTPAYANDLSTDSTGNVDGVITYGAGPSSAGKRVFCISGVGVFAESGELATEGWVEQGGISFNSADPKTALYLVVDHDPLQGGKVLVDVKYDSSDWREVGSNDQLDSVTVGKIPLQNNFRVVQVRYRLQAGGSLSNVSPLIRRMEFRALNVPGSASQFMLPLMLRDTYYTDQAQQMRSAADDYDFLTNLWAERREWTYREANQQFTVRATDFLWLPEFQNANGSAYEGLLVLTAKEIA